MLRKVELNLFESSAGPALGLCICGTQEAQFLEEEVQFLEKAVQFSEADISHQVLASPSQYCSLQRTRDYK